MDSPVAVVAVGAACDPHRGGHITPAETEQLRFAGYARLYAVAAFLVPMLTFVNPWEPESSSRATRSQWDAVLAGDGMFPLMLLVIYAGLVLSAVFNPARTGVAAAIAAGSLVTACVIGLPPISAAYALTDAGRATVFAAGFLTVVGVIHEYQLAVHRTKSRYGSQPTP